MKTIALAILACLPVFAAGTVGVSINALGPQQGPGGLPENRVHIITITWVGDSVTGTVPSTVVNISQFPQLSGYRLVSIEIQPGTPSPSTNYSITLTDAAGIDLLAGNGANLSATVASYTGSLLSPPLITSPTFNLSGNSVASAKGTIQLYFAPLSQVAAARGLPATLPGTNPFTGTNSFSGTVNSNNLSSGNVANKPASSDAMRFVTNSGNDANDGFSWGTAKLTIGGACASLPSGNGTCSAGTGTIMVSPNFSGTQTQPTVSGISVLYQSNASTATGGWNWQNSGSFGNTQMVELVESDINGCSAKAEYQAAQTPSSFATDGVSGCLATPSSSTTIQSNAVAGYANSLSTTTNAVGVYASARALANSTKMWSINPICMDGGFSNVICKSEFDFNVNNSTTVGPGLQLAGSWQAQPTANNMPAFQVTRPVQNGGGCPTNGSNNCGWTSGLTIGTGSVVGGNAISLSPVLSGTNQPSQFVEFNAVTAGGAGNTASINSNPAGLITLNNGQHGFGGVVITSGDGLQLNGSTSGQTQILPQATASGALTLPSATDTLVARATTDSLTNKTLNVPLTSGTGLQIFNTTTTCTTGAAVGSTCTTANISLPVAEADTSYRVSCTGKGLTNVPVTIATANASASQFTITIAALTAAAASFASYDCVAGHN